MMKKILIKIILTLIVGILLLSPVGCGIYFEDESGTEKNQTTPDTTTNEELTPPNNSDGEVDEPENKAMEVLIDTDIGVDCDDAVALASAIYLQKKGKINILGISTCARNNASASANAIINHYNMNIPVAKFNGEKLSCDDVDNYNTILKNTFSSHNSDKDSVRLLRQKLVNAKNKVTLIAIGPLNVIASLLDSRADDISPLNGIELVEEKVDVFYSMAGNFSAYNPNLSNMDFPEWNVLQDIGSAQKVIRRMPVNVVFCPYEVGYNVLSGEVFEQSHPAGLAIKSYYDNDTGSFPGRYARQSWDPITVFVAIGEDLCEYSNYGTISIDSSGKTTFIEGVNGKHRYLIPKYEPETVASKLNGFYSELENL